jgi:hypothetical protein
MGIPYADNFYGGHFNPIQSAVILLGRGILGWDKNQAPGTSQVER